MIIASKPGTMSSAELRDYIYRLGITQSTLARITHYSSGQINAMCRGRGPVPETVAIITRLMILYPDIRDDLIKGIEGDGYDDKYTNGSISADDHFTKIAHGEFILGGE